MTTTTEPTTVPRRVGLDFVWLEITGKCQLECIHCYAESGPAGTRGAMQRSDWLGVIDQCADLGVGIVQFIGGEPTLHPDLAILVEYTLGQGLEEEIFSVDPGADHDRAPVGITGANPDPERGRSRLGRVLDCGSDLRVRHDAGS